MTAPDGPEEGGHVPAVEEARALLRDVDGRPVEERAEVLDAVHRRLQDALASLDEQV